MVSEDYTESSLTTKPDDLIALYKKSGLPTEHHSRRTETGFLIRADRLPNCIPLPTNKIPTRSWIWDHGYVIRLLTKKNKVLKHWLCQICYEKDPPLRLSLYMINTKVTTTKVINHLKDLH
jgi:hypothetical protein